MKGASIEFPVNRCLGFLKEIGLENADLVLKSDQEPSIMDVLNNVAKRRSASSKLELLEGISEFLGSGTKSVVPEKNTGRTIQEAPPVRSSGSNGVIERAIQAIEGQIRTLKLALDGAGIPDRSRDIE